MSKEQIYTVLSPLLRNGEAHEPGSRVKMPPEEAEALIAAGVLAEMQPLPADEDDDQSAAGDDNQHAAGDGNQPAAGDGDPPEKEADQKTSQKKGGQQKGSQKKAGQKKGDGQ